MKDNIHGNSTMTMDTSTNGAIMLPCINIIADYVEHVLCWCYCKLFRSTSLRELGLQSAFYWFVG